LLQEVLEIKGSANLIHDVDVDEVPDFFNQALSLTADFVEALSRR